MLDHFTWKSKEARKGTQNALAKALAAAKQFRVASCSFQR